MLRWPHGHHRAVRCRLDAAQQAERDARRDRDRHVMMDGERARFARECCSLGLLVDDRPRWCSARSNTDESQGHRSSLQNRHPNAASRSKLAFSARRRQSSGLHETHAAPSLPGKIPIASVDPGAPLAAPSFTGGFRTPAVLRAADATMPASEKPAHLLPMPSSRIWSTIERSCRSKRTCDNSLNGAATPLLAWRRRYRPQLPE